jgi:hypothetical protein
MSKIKYKTNFRLALFLRKFFLIKTSRPLKTTIYSLLTNAALKCFIGCFTGYNGFIILDMTLYSYNRNTFIRIFLDFYYLDFYYGGKYSEQ